MVKVTNRIRWTANRFDCPQCHSKNCVTDNGFCLKEKAFVW